MSPLLAEYSPRFMSQPGYLDSRHTNQSAASATAAEDDMPEDEDVEGSSVAGTESTSRGSFTSVE